MIVIVAGRRVLRLHQTHPVQTRLPAEGRVLDGRDIRKSSPVRIAGVDVGKISHISREGNAGLVTMEIESSGLPIHSDATVKIRPRTFLEGNWFVELQPGSPSAKVLSSGYTLPITQTSDPVQLDQVLDALNTETRADLQNFLIGYGDGLTRKPDAAENAEQDPELYGLNGAQALNKAYQLGPASLRGTAVLNQAISGTSPTISQTWSRASAK